MSLETLETKLIEFFAEPAKYPDTDLSATRGELYAYLIGVNDGFSSQFVAVKFRAIKTIKPFIIIGYDEISEHLEVLCHFLYGINIACGSNFDSINWFQVYCDRYLSEFSSS